MLYDCDATDDGQPDIFVHDLRTDERTNLTKAPGVDLIARFSPDGRDIAFGSSRSGNWEVYLMRADGTGLRQLTDDAGFDGDPIFVPAAHAAALRPTQK